MGIERKKRKNNKICMKIAIIKTGLLVLHCNTEKSKIEFPLAVFPVDDAISRVMCALSEMCRILKVLNAK